MEEYRVDIKVKNNIILQKIEKAGYKTVGEFCRINEIMKYTSQLGNIINMKESPLQTDGKFRSCLIHIADLLGCDPVDFFTDTQLHTVLKSNKRSIQVNEAEMKFMLEKTNEPKLLENVVLEDQRNDALNEALSTLSPREQKIVQMRMGLAGFDEHTFDQLAEIFGITRERIRQIEAKAIRKLRHPTRSDKLKTFMDNEDE